MKNLTKQQTETLLFLHDLSQGEDPWFERTMEENWGFATSRVLTNLQEKGYVYCYPDEDDTPRDVAVDLYRISLAGVIKAREILGGES